MIAAALLMILAVGGYWALLYSVQRQMLFPIPRAPAASQPPEGVAGIWLQTSSGAVEAWYLAPRPTPTGPAPLIVFTHGNGELIDFWPDRFDEPRAWGFGILLVEYPGYGRSQGRPSQATIEETVEAAYEWAIAQPTVDANRIVAYGRSVGGGAACALIRKRTVAALILESSFTSVAAFARSYGAPRFLVRDPFDNEAALRGYRGPLLILHGADDAIIPPDHARRLAAAAPQAELHLLACGHNDCPRAWPIIRTFVASHAIVDGEPAKR